MRVARIWPISPRFSSSGRVAISRIWRLRIIGIWPIAPRPGGGGITVSRIWSLRIVGVWPTPPRSRGGRITISWFWRLRIVGVGPVPPRSSSSGRISRRVVILPSGSLTWVAWWSYDLSNGRTWTSSYQVQPMTQNRENSDCTRGRLAASPRVFWRLSSGWLGLGLIWSGCTLVIGVLPRVS